MKQWFLKNNRAAYEKLTKEGATPLVALLLANRGIDDAAEAKRFLQPSLNDLQDPFLFQDMANAVALIGQFLEEMVPIRIVGDYDQDGVAATTILIKGLQLVAQQFGENLVSYAIPDRIEDGYGINRSIVDAAIEEGVGLIITCDNGISAFDAIEYARNCGLSVIVTDHHQIAEEDGKELLPPADAVLNPHSKASGYPFADLCGAGVAFKLIQAVCETFGIDKDAYKPLLQFAALGTICDVVPLQGENRIIAAAGLQEINADPNPGIKALLQESSWEKTVTGYTVGFVIGPAVNASGRLFTARLGVELFLEKDPDTIAEYARELVSLNTERKQMTAAGVESAYEIVESAPKLDDILVIYIPSVHESICGLIAGRVKERYYRPTIVVTESAEDDAILKGSGRSIEAYNMYEQLLPLKDLFLSFGGHAMACGLSMEKEKLADLRKQLLEKSTLTTLQMTPVLEMEGQLPVNRVDFQTVETIGKLEPFGAKNPRPKFADKGIAVKGVRVLGKNQNVLKFALEKDGKRIDAIQFSAEDTIASLQEKNPSAWNAWTSGKPSAETIDIAYVPDLNTYNGRTTLQLNIVDLRISTH